MTTRRITIVLLLCLVPFDRSSFDLAAQSLADYTRIARLYQSGQGGEAVEELAQWPRASMDAAFRAALPALSGDEKIAAAMVHTELANIFLVPQKSVADYHVGIAGKLLEAAAADPRSRSRAELFTRRWRYFLISMYTADGALNDASFYLHSGIEKYPRDPMMYVAAGAIAEVRGQGNNDIRRDPAQRPRSAIPDSQLQAAVGQYLKALGFDGHVALAHLHIGWIRLSLHDDERARPELEAAIADAENDATRYLAHLFLGAVDEHVRQLEDAKREYEAAIAVGERYQTGYVALSRTEEALGHHARAQELALLCTQIVKRDDDPWWDYRLRFDREALQTLRREAMHR